MAKCSVCDSETLLYVNDKPLCSACDAARNPGPLYRQVTAAKAELVALSKQFDALNNKEIVAGTHGIPYPDSVGIVESLGATIRASFNKYHAAFTAYIAAIRKR
jgi:hypothetical protein